MAHLTFGSSKSLEHITLEDVMQHPIWVWALDEEGFEGQDETWQKPITSTTDLSRSILGEFLTATITLKLLGTDLYGSGEYDHRDRQLVSISIWQDGKWTSLREVISTVPPVEFEALPTIEGKPGVRFVCNNLRAEEAFRTDVPAGSGGLVGLLKRLLLC